MFRMARLPLLPWPFSSPTKLPAQRCIAACNALLLNSYCVCWLCLVPFPILRRDPPPPPPLFLFLPPAACCKLPLALFLLRYDRQPLQCDSALSQVSQKSKRTQMPAGRWNRVSDTVTSLHLCNDWLTAGMTCCPLLLYIVPSLSIISLQKLKFGHDGSRARSYLSRVWHVIHYVFIIKMYGLDSWSVGMVQNQQAPCARFVYKATGSNDNRGRIFQHPITLESPLVLVFRVYLLLVLQV